MFYTIKVFCQNCKKVNEPNIPKGVKVEDFECHNCGCKTLSITAIKELNKTQEDLLKLINQVNLNGKTLRDIGDFIGIENKPQLVKHHLEQLVKKDYIIWDIKDKEILPTDKGKIDW
jgi:hypothetical protein